MSVDAMSYVKSIEWDHRASWSLLLVIAENTFNDTGICRVGQSILAEESRSSERTVRNNLRILAEGEIIKITPCGDPNGGRLPDEIFLIGFLEWLSETRKRKSAKVAGKGEGGNRQELPVQTGKFRQGNRQLVAGLYKDTRTSNRTSDARAARKDNFDFGSEGSVEADTPAPGPQEVAVTRNTASWDRWLSYLEQADRPTAERMRKAFVVFAATRDPLPNSPPPRIPDAAIRGKAHRGKAA